MANLKAIRNRIKSVRSTEKITHAMRLVAAAKVKRAQSRVEAARPFTQKVVALLQEVAREEANIDLFEVPLLVPRAVRKVGIIVLSSDRGLCGSYNANIFKAVTSRIQELDSEGKAATLILVGLKAVAFFRNVKIEKLRTYTLLPAIPTVEEAKLISEQACQAYTQGQVDAIEIVSTDFISLLRSQVVTTSYLPLAAPEVPLDRPPTPERIFEPSMQDVLEEQIIPMYLENVIYQALLEASASELAARMNAMSNASNNARDLLQSLTLVYNKARQASITQELLEIVGGTEALRQ